MTATAPTGAARVALITGGNTGIGRVTARELARAGYRVFIACRSAERARPVLDEVRAMCGDGAIENIALELGRLDSVRACARDFLDRGLPLHLLVNNAGLAGARGMTPSGFELAFGVNHVGHFLLTSLLLERLRGSAPARIVTVASRAHYRAPGIDWDAVRKPTTRGTGLPEYCVSKLANVLFSAELARRLAGSGVTTYSLHPGVVATDIWRQVPVLIRPLMTMFMISSERGAATTLHCATSPALAGQTGLYYDDCKVKVPSAPARDVALGAELWKRSEAWLP
jgi:retinol dehydrogenase-12